MHIKPDQIDPDAAKVVQRLRRYDHTAYLVGGCVRDLLLGRKPKDFDVATSANPNEIKRLFRNCRIIGRRFRLAHIFFGAKIIETATFRANPREVEDDPSESSGGDGENSDLLIRRDNVFGSAEEDARRRDFTINGLFYDLETAQVIDYVHGMADLETRLVRTIGDPDIRFREDPVRILRAVKFAARCDLTVEPETYRRMMEHSGEIAKCAQARVSEEFYRLLRAGAAKRSMELLLETRLLDVLVPELANGLRHDGDAAHGKQTARFWAYLAALDRSTTKRDIPPSNALVLAALLFPPLRDALHPDTNNVRDVGQLVGQSTQPIIERLKSSRRDAELARQILLAMRYLFPSSNPNRRRPRLSGREFLDDALRLAELVTDAETATPELAGQPLLAEGEPPGAPAGEELPPELQAPDPSERHGRFRHGRRGREERATRFEERREPAPESGGGYQRPASVGGRTPIPDLTRLPARAPNRPAFLGTGTFGRWGNSGE
ncbi:MAG TPA: polynucleotide adenylyltransferase PcnB [Polyangia bacterium]|nr:polynucleotide adenylyltransferase PcnB [Polyangia bacterium]